MSAGEGLVADQDDLRRENESLRRRNDELSQRVTELERASSARAATGEALRKSEALFRAVVEKSADAISLTEADGTTRYLTPSVAPLLGWTHEEMVTRTARDQVFPEDQARIAVAIENLVKSGDRGMNLEFRVRHRDGSTLWIGSCAANLLGDPAVGAIVTSYRDITAHKHAEEAARESRRLLEEAQAIAHIGSWTSGIGQSDAIAWSPECYRIFGIAQGTAMTVASFMDCLYVADRDEVGRASRDACEHGAPYDLEHRVQRADGTIRWVHERAVVERDAEGRPIRMIGAVQDITDRRAAEEALKSGEERYRRIVENTSEGIWIYDTQGITTFMNARMAEMVGYTLAEAIGMHVFAFMAPSARAEAQARMDRRRRGESERSDFHLRRKDGTELTVSIQANPLFDSAASVEAVLSLVTDVSAQRRADEVRARMAAVVESSEDAILSASLDGTITSWNPGATKLYEYSSEEALGRNLSMLLPPAILEVERHILTRVARGEAMHSHETQRLRKHSGPVDVAVTISPIRDATGAVVGVSGIVRDLTARKAAEAALHRTEEQFRQAQKMEAVGRLAGGVAHDFNNVLSVILSYADLAIDALKHGDPMLGDMREIQTAGRRAAELTHQLLAFSRQQVRQPRVIDVNKVVTEMQRMLGRLLGEDVELAFHPAPELGRVLADPGQLEQVLMNLVVNARDAMLDGGKLTIETDDVTLDTAYVSAHLGVAPGRYVLIAVSDTGTGMDAATRARLFEPFFTTKEVGRGTGLGLATVFGIVQQSGGHVGVYTEPGHGSTFKVYLPRTDQPTAAPSATASPKAARGTETILLVEDEQQVRVVACAILRRNGYRVLDASNGGEALLLARDFVGEIQLLLTDVVMPRMSGRKLAEELAPLQPAMSVLFASGYTDDAIVHHGVLDAGVAFLQKPFTPGVLLRKVREVLDARGDRTVDA